MAQRSVPCLPLHIHLSMWSGRLEDSNLKGFFFLNGQVISEMESALFWLEMVGSVFME